MASAVNMVSSNPYIGPSQGIQISFPLLSICTDELISAPKKMTFFPKLLSANKNSGRESTPMSYSLYFYLSRSAFLVGFKIQISNYLMRNLFKILNCGFRV